MPELPEVETVVRGLKKTVVGKTFSRVTVNAPENTIEIGSSFNAKPFGRLLEGRKILEINRRGKNILMHLSDEITLWVHLKMTGHFFYLPSGNPVDKHDLVIFDFASSGSKRSGAKLLNYHLRFNDYRRFGRLRLYKNSELWEQDGLKNLGPEPLKISPDDFVLLCQKSSRMIKPALLDQSFIAGLGNIYTDEVLHASKINPRRLTSSLSKKKLVEVHYHIQRILKQAVKKMGTSVDSYTGINGQPGSFQKYLKVYGRDGEKCLHCGGKIVREKIGSRSAHFCPGCQRMR